MKAAIARGLGKRQGVWCVALAGALHLSASAQSTLALEMGPPPSQGPGVELYGLVDVAASYIDNQGGSSRLSQLGVGGDRGNRWGVRGREDLGGGKQAFFVLEGGINMSTGAALQGGLTFGRLTIVGLRDQQWGEVTLGNQYDFMYDLVGYSAAATGNGGLYAFHLGNLDRTAGDRMNNSVRYKSPSWGGFRVGAMYSWDAVAANPASNVGRSFTASYAAGPWSVGAAYTSVANHAQVLGIGTQVLGYPLINFASGAVFDKLTTGGIGVSYAKDRLYAGAMLTTAQLVRGGSSARMNMQDIGASYQFSPGWVVGGALSFYQMDDKRWTTLTGGVQYFFSRRTNVYANFASLRASGPNNNQAQLFTALASSSRSQFSTMVGIRHVF